jgi:hypothetical protein
MGNRSAGSGEGPWKQGWSSDRRTVACGCGGLALASVETRWSSHQSQSLSQEGGAGRLARQAATSVVKQPRASVGGKVLSGGILAGPGESRKS